MASMQNTPLGLPTTSFYQKAQETTHPVGPQKDVCLPTSGEDAQPQPLALRFCGHCYAWKQEGPALPRARPVGAYLE